MKTIGKFLKSLTCPHETYSIRHDWHKLTAVVTCARCGTLITEFHLKQQMDFALLSDGEGE